MKHLFDVDFAVRYGIDVSIFMHHIHYWVNFNKNEGTNFHEGKFWTYNKIKSFSKHFPYWSHKQIERIINKCFDAGLLIKSNFNELKYDRTCWYTLSNLAEELLNFPISRNRDFDFPESGQSFPGIGTPIPDNKPDNKQQIKDKRIAQPKKQVAVVSEPIVLPDWLPRETWEEFKQHRKQLKKPMSDLAQKKSIKKLERMRSEGQDVVEVIEASIANGWQGLFEIKSQGVNHGKDSKYYGSNGKFDSMQYLLDSIREDEERKLRESKENNCLPESDLSSEDGKYIQYDGTSVFSY